jgi:predicted MPP superfamily phosphohydrolase
MQADLRFRADGAFTIAQFTDLHVQNGEPADAQTVALMADVLDAEQPDLAVLTGDVIDGKHSRDPAAAWRYAVAPLVGRGIPWAAVFGNHDDEGTMTRAELMALQRTLPYCLSQAGPADVSGVGNYVLPVRSAGGEKTAATLYFLDSNSYAETKIGGYGWVRRDQIAWYLQTAQALAAANGGEPLPALAFFHIPLSEYNEAWDLHVCYGHKFEPVCCPLINTGFYAALHEAGDVMGTFVGHDHVNDFEGELYGIRLCYGRATGFNTYGRQGFTRGARLIQLREGVRDFRTWLRLEGGEVVTEQPQHEPLLQRRTCIL